MLNLEVFPDHESMSHAAADWLIQRVRQFPDGLLCLASGGTPSRAYTLFAEHFSADPAAVARLRLLKLDEWGGLAGDDPASCEAHLRSAVVAPLAMENRFISFRGQAADPDEECRRVAAWLAAHGPIDIAVLGLGVNGHVGFNEPREFLRPHAHVAPLSADSLRHAMLAACRVRPRYGLTLGMADLLHARHVLLVVSGGAKRAALARLMRDEISTAFPASLLTLHPSVRLICDAAAAS